MSTCQSLQREGQDGRSQRNRLRQVPLGVLGNLVASPPKSILIFLSSVCRSPLQGVSDGQDEQVWHLHDQSVPSGAPDASPANALYSHSPGFSVLALDTAYILHVDFWVHFFFFLHPLKQWLPVSWVLSFSFLISFI